MFSTRIDEMEWMPYCMAILCNLARRSKSVCSRIKKSVCFSDPSATAFTHLHFFQTSYKAFSRRVIKLLSHDSRIVVVSSLVLVGYLEEKVRDMVRKYSLLEWTTATISFLPMVSQMEENNSMCGTANLSLPGMLRCIHV